MTPSAAEGTSGRPGRGRRVGFARWRSDLASGGTRYDEELTAALRSRGLEVREYPVTGSWPLPSDGDRRRLSGVFAREQDWLIGNIVASAVPEQVADAVSAGRRVTILVHYFPADDPALPAPDRLRLAAAEAESVRAASRVVVTSAWAGAAVAARYGRHDAVVAVPGVDPAVPAPGSVRRGRAPMLLWLARLTPGKDPLTVVEALARLQDLDWTARLVGPDTVDEVLSRRVRERIAQTGLTGRVEVTGPLHGRDLDAVWDATDLLVHTSRAETYGMVVAEALARGIPSVVASGTGAVEAQGAGETFPAGDVGSLAEVLRAWLADERLRDRWRRDAAGQCASLTRWPDTAARVAAALTSGTAPVPPRPAPGARRPRRGHIPPAPSA
ncbi:glycosyltransferase family 4 protein [Micrococcus sp. TA1]|uniref:glycosyltransferase family 4 protein n=1 Tax=Micrococcus sp. TA1 TaxID=681627 RepID=UPI001616CEAC|nr:glycosyltransferase family 4 protein [Micrococcus sp. TA1]MBB5748679.1 glycosyltransferase involved in cell wall biosynthesis [Micrococcus sp. TA1]